MFFFGDSWDLYATPADAYAGAYWDSGTTNFTIVAGRFSGSRSVQFNGTTNTLQKSSGANDSIHHFNVSVLQSSTSSGSLGFAIQILDGATAQCTVAFRGDGAIVLLAGSTIGAVIATYTGAFLPFNIWYNFEIEVIIHNTTGSIAIRKNGNTSNDFSATGLNTRNGTANAYANRITLGAVNAAVNHQVDDFLWRSDASSVPWVGDVRCYTRMPATDASVQWTPSGAIVPMPSFPGGAANTISLFATNFAYMQPFVPVCNGTIGSLSLTCATAVTANIKCAIYASVAGAPTTVLGGANLVTNPGVGTTTFTFATPVAVTQGTTYYAAFRQDVTSGSFSYSSATPPGGYTPLTGTTTYAAFPTANPVTGSTAINFGMTVNITPMVAVNAPMVADTQQDAAVTYVSSSTVGQTDLYGIAPISGTPTGIIGVTTRALCQKSDAGTRNVALRLRSGATDVTGTSTALNTTFGWIWRSDAVDPATGAAWSAVSVNNLLIGETVTA